MATAQGCAEPRRAIFTPFFYRVIGRGFYRMSSVLREIFHIISSGVNGLVKMWNRLKEEVSGFIGSPEACGLILR